MDLANLCDEFEFLSTRRDPVVSVLERITPADEVRHSDAKQSIQVRPPCAEVLSEGRHRMEAAGVDALVLGKIRKNLVLIFGIGKKGLRGSAFSPDNLMCLHDNLEVLDTLRA